jgi:SnoaL-like domain
MLDVCASSEPGGDQTTPRVHQQPHSYRHKDGAPVSERLDATQHLITGVLPEIDGDTATVVASLMAVHRRSNATGGSLWTVGGTYRFGLRRAGDRWLIDGLSLRVAWVDGNQGVIGGAVVTPGGVRWGFWSPGWAQESCP